MDRVLTYCFIPVLVEYLKSAKSLISLNKDLVFLLVAIVMGTRTCGLVSMKRRYSECSSLKLCKTIRFCYQCFFVFYLR